MGKHTEEEMEGPNESLSESGENIHHIEEKRKEHLRKKLDSENESKRPIIDTISPATIMPLVERNNQGEIQKITK